MLNGVDFVTEAAIDNLSPEQLFARGITTTSRYFLGLSETDRALVLPVMDHHPALTLADAIDALWWHGGL